MEGSQETRIPEGGLDGGALIREGVRGEGDKGRGGIRVLYLWLLWSLFGVSIVEDGIWMAGEVLVYIMRS